MSEPYTVKLRGPRGPIGTIGMVIAGKVLEVLHFIDDESEFEDLVARRYPQGCRYRRSDPSGIADMIAGYLDGRLDTIKDICTRPSGTPFQQSVWQGLRKIRCGTVISYAELAKWVDKPRAYRALGQANASNPIAIVHPCHRVIGSNGTLTGYGGGLARKAWLLRHEGFME